MYENQWRRLRWMKKIVQRAQRQSQLVLNGDEILEIAKIENGPLLGKLVKELKSMYRNELIFTKEEAKFFVKNLNTEKN